MSPGDGERKCEEDVEGSKSNTFRPIGLIRHMAVQFNRREVAEGHGVFSTSESF